MEIRSFTPYLILISLLVVTALALAFTVDVEMHDRAGIRLKLPADLEGGWQGDELRYSHNPENPRQYRISELEFANIDPDSGEQLFTMSREEYEALPKDTEFIKSVYTNDVSGDLFVSIVLSGRARDSIHRPERCVTGQGYSILATRYIDVPLEGREPLKVAVMETSRTFRDREGERQTRYSFYAYWFAGQNRETASHYARMFWLAWDRVFHSLAHRWAYIAVAGDREEGSDAYRQTIIEFVQKLYPHLTTEGPEADQAGV